MFMAFVRYAGTEWVALTLSQVGKLAIAAALQLLWVYTAELYPTKYRSLAVGLGLLFARVGSICSPFINDFMVSVAAYCVLSYMTALESTKCVTV